MKLLIMCEGPNELKIINILLENQKLKFTSDDLLGLVPYHARQIKSSAAVKAALNLYPDEVHVLRIGDGQNEKLEIPSAYKDKITLVEKYCTKPELEMLLIISEDLADEYEKVKSKTKPKTFAKANIRCGKRRYDNSREQKIEFPVWWNIIMIYERSYSCTMRLLFFLFCISYN